MQGSEDRLLEAFLGGSETAFEELVRESRDRLYRTAMRILNNHDDALDVIQDSLVKAYKRASGFRRESSFSTWLTSIVVREAINKAKRDRFRNALSLHTLAGAPSGSGRRYRDLPGRSSDVRPDVSMDAAAAHTIPGRIAAPDEAAEAAIMADKVRQAVESLPPAQRAVFTLKHYEGLKTSEIAELTGSREGTVKANYFHAVRKLRVKLSPFVERGEQS
ncbi:MAG: RNA polymerase sigma factor [Candidatus Eisenbacteria bacterium]|nr:RNA polymerase sigma factor [Candidatus Eisenbacteria bacterium]